MSSLSFSVALAGGETCNFVSGTRICNPKNKDLQLTGPFTGIHGAWLRHSGPSMGGRRRGCIVARIKRGKRHEYPWPRKIDSNPEKGYVSHLSEFKPLTEKPKPVTLAFEKPLIDLEKKIDDVRKMAEETGLDFSNQISSLEKKYQQALRKLYTHLAPIQRLQIARHPNRPTCLDHVLSITDKFVELHGDRAGFDDPAIVTGLGSIEGKTYMFMGHQKGRNTKENIRRNFGMPTPHGYRKALRMMRYADHHGFPIITLIDTPGAFADMKCEELGQGEAIAFNLREMFSLKVPIVSIVIGEGGSGGALAIGCGNKLLMLENAVFYVASPEACAAILWKTSEAAPKAARKLRITARELQKLKIADGVIPEPLAGAHTDPAWTSQQIKLAVTKAVAELETLDPERLIEHRQLKFRYIGRFKENPFVEPERKRNMKPKDDDFSNVIAEIQFEIDNLKNKARNAKGKVPSTTISAETIVKLGKEIEEEMADAFISMGLQEKLEALKMEISESAFKPSPVLEKIDELKQEFRQRFSQPDSYLGLKQKINTLMQVVKLTKTDERVKLMKTDERVKRMKIRRQASEVESAIKKEIEKAVDVGGFRGKIDELKEAVKNKSSREKVMEQEKALREGILAVLDVEKLKKMVENLDQESVVGSSVDEEEVVENLDQESDVGSSVDGGKVVENLSQEPVVGSTVDGEKVVENLNQESVVGSSVDGENSRI